MQAIVSDIERSAPDERVAALAERHPLAPRTLQRLFARYVGVGPKWVMQRYRLHDAIDPIQRNTIPQKDHIGTSGPAYPMRKIAAASPQIEERA